MDVAQLRTLLTRPEAYPNLPEPPGRVESLQTHVSLLFFAGDRVYKIRKPVKFDFLDATTLEKRRHFCEEEVRLNRRLAGEIYHGVVPIVKASKDRLVVGRPGMEMAPDEEVIEYAVEMDRLPADRMLSSLLERGKATDSMIDGLADRLAAFHQKCATGEEVNRYATPEEVRAQVDANLCESGASLDSLLGIDLISPFRAWFERTVNELTPLMKARIEEGRVREGHGDLHAGNICVRDAADEKGEKIVIYDRIEFTPKFRCRDVAADLAFLTMDLRYRGEAARAERLIDRYVERSGDDGLRSLLRLYETHLALVRGKVALLKSAEAEVPHEERKEAEQEALRYVTLAFACMLGPALILLCGLPATGKSFVSRRLSELLRCPVLRSDEVRKELAGIEPSEDPGERREAMYSDEFTARTYGRLRERAEAALDENRPVIIDATLPTAERRGQLIGLAQEREIPWVLLHLEASDETVRRRMTARARDEEEVSDANFEVYRQAKQEFESPEELDPDRVIELAGELDDRQIARSVVHALNRAAGLIPEDAGAHRQPASPLPAS